MVAKINGIYAEVTSAKALERILTNITHPMPKPKPVWAWKPKSAAQPGGAK